MLAAAPSEAPCRPPKLWFFPTRNGSQNRIYQPHVCYTPLATALEPYELVESLGNMCLDYIGWAAPSDEPSFFAQTLFLPDSPPQDCALQADLCIDCAPNTSCLLFCPAPAGKPSPPLSFRASISGLEEPRTCICSCEFLDSSPDLLLPPPILGKGDTLCFESNPPELTSTILCAPCSDTSSFTSRSLRDMSPFSCRAISRCRAIL